MHFSCFDETALVFKTSASNVGFARIASSSGTTGTSPNIVKKYTAESMLLEASAIADGSLSVSTDWYFECTLTICYDDSTGQCGGVSLLTLKAPSIICSRRQFQMLLLFQK